MLTNQLLRFCGLLFVAGLLCGCGQDPSAWGFSLPKGDVEVGKTTFQGLGCPACHRVANHEDLRPEEGFEAEMNLLLGGLTTRKKTYGELVTGIINPSHRIAKGYRDVEVDDDGVSRMPNYNSIMTVQQLIDVVSFLEEQYELPEYPASEYVPY